MKTVLAAFLAVSFTQALAQGHDQKPAEALQKIAFLKGDWTGKQDFNTGGAPMVGDATDNVSDAIGGRYFEERLSTTLPGRKPSDTRHFLTFDPTAGKFKAWWFNDSSVGAMELEGDVTGNKLVLLSKPTKTGSGNETVFRATYEKVSETELGFTLEIKAGSDWRSLFHTAYSKKT